MGAGGSGVKPPLSKSCFRRNPGFEAAGFDAAGFEAAGFVAAGFERAAQSAKAGCPVSKALTGVEISLDASLES